MSQHRKNYKAAETSTAIAPTDHPATTWTIKTKQVTFDFSRWLYIGRPKIDEPFTELNQQPLTRKSAAVGLVNAGRPELVSALYNAIWRQHSRWRSSTLANICNSLTPFFEFLDERHGSEQAVTHAKHITAALVENYIDWLLHYRTVNTQTGHHSYSGAKSIFSPLSCVLEGLVDMRLIDAAAVPRNPFPNHRRAIVSAEPYSRDEMNSILTALKADLRSIREKTFIGGDSDILAIYFLLLAARTGRNFTPLLELTRNSLSDHPIKPDEWAVLTTYKYRGYSVHQQIFEKQPVKSKLMTVPADVATLYREVLAYTEAMAVETDVQSDGRLWLYRSRGKHEYGQVCHFTEAALKHAISRFTLRHQLLADNHQAQRDTSQPLLLNTRRLRATFVNRLWKLTGGDIVRTAVLAGNTPAMTNSHYLDLTPEMQKNFKFIGHAYELTLRGDADSEQARQQMQAELGIDPEMLSMLLDGRHNTGVSRCSDPLHGRYAPKDGASHCNAFLYCFKCPNQVILETDLHRLYSFYWLVYRERHYFPRARWKAIYGWVITVIDTEIAPRFRTKAVREAKVLAYKAPHPMWRTREMLQGEPS